VLLLLLLFKRKVGSVSSVVFLVYAHCPRRANEWGFVNNDDDEETDDAGLGVSKTVASQYSSFASSS
jgi:hypothetical protein